MTFYQRNGKIEGGTEKEVCKYQESSYILNQTRYTRFYKNPGIKRHAMQTRIEYMEANILCHIFVINSLRRFKTFVL